MHKFFSTLILALALPFFAQAQAQHVCGTDYRSEGYETMKDRLLSNIRTAAANPGAPRTITYIPVKFHIGAKTDGTGRISESNLLDMLCELNEDYAPYDFQFFFAGGTFNYINNTAFYENHSATTNSVMAFQRDSRALNVFIVESANTDGGNGNGVTLAYYNIPRDWIVITKTYIRKDDNTLSHEIGHFFSLNHTFSGWESEAYNTENVPAPVNSPGGVPTERQNRTNCENAGDFICDTDADYNNGLGWNGCDFTRNVLDPQGNRIDPHERNHMSYFLSCPDEEYNFSDIQVSTMRADNNSFSRNFLRINAIPEYREITEQATPISPIDNQMVEGYNNVQLQWSAVTNADAYFLEVSRVPSFTISPIRYIVYGNSKVVTGLEANKTYYWRVRPYNAHATCVPLSSAAAFTTGSLVNTDAPDFVEAFNVFPNPVVGGNSITVRLQTQESFAANVQLLDVMGRTTGISRDVQFAAGVQQVELSVAQLPAGIYFLQMTTQAGRMSQKVIITQ